MTLAIRLKEVNAMFAKVSYPTFPGKMAISPKKSTCFRMIAQCPLFSFFLLYKIWNVGKTRISCLLHAVKNSL